MNLLKLCFQKGGKMAKKRSKKGLPPFLPSIMYPKKRGKKAAPKIPPGKKPREYELLNLDDLAKVLVYPLEAITVLAEEIRDRILAEIVSKKDLKKELFNLKMLYDSDMLTKDEYKKSVEKLISELKTVKEHNKTKEEER